jgi:hypothetical protein
MTFVLEPAGEGVDLVVTGEWSSSARQALEDGEADGVVLNYARGFRPQPIDFLQGLPIRRLNLLERSLSDVSPVYSLASSLEELRLQIDPRVSLELERLPLVRTLAAAWPQIQGSIMFASQLEYLSVPSYTENDLTPLSSLSSLSSLIMKERPKLRSLDGIDGFPWLAHLGVHGARGLEEISALRRWSSPVLTTLRLPSCRRVVDIVPVAACPSLRFFELSEGGEIPSVAAVGDLQLLERLSLYGSTKVVDGDLSPIARLSRLTDFRMQSRPAYAPSVSEIQATIARRP